MPQRTFDPSLVATITVPHTEFARGLKRIQEVYDSAGSLDAEPLCLAVIGASGSGKSKLIKRLLKKYPPERTPDGLLQTVLIVEVPADPKVKSLVEACLLALGDPLWDNNDATNKKTARLIVLMTKARVRVLCLDEFHHFYDKATDRVQLLVTDWLKGLINLNRFSVVVAGMEVSSIVLSHNPQLRDRFQAPVKLPRFDWTIKAHKNDWAGMLRAFTEAIRLQHDIVDLHEPESSFRLYLACGGRVRPLVNTLAEAVRRASSESRSEIGIEHLEAAYAKVVWNQFTWETWNVFDMAKPAPGNVKALVDCAMGIHEDDEVQVGQKRKRRRRLPSGVKEALSAQY